MKKWHTVQDYLVIVFCACLLALSYHIFVFPNEFAPSGLPGIATIIQHVFHFKVGYMTILINVPLVLLTYYIVDHRYAVLSATFAVVFSVVLLALDYVNLAPFEYHTTTGTSTILAPIAGGVISGFCYGMVMRRDSSTGGTDLLAALVHHVRPEMHIIWIVFAINAIVAALSYFVYDFKIEPVILCLIYCYLTSSISDRILKGDFAPGFFIDHFIKDLGLCLEECRRMKLVLPGTAAAEQVYRIMQAKGQGSKGTQALIQGLADISGATWTPCCK